MEHYYLQGVSQIVVYDDNNSDHVQSLNDLYAKHNRSYLKVLPALWPEGEGETGSSRSVAARAEYIRESNYLRCFRDHPDMDWILYIDVDEYMWSPKYATLPELLGSSDVPENITNVRIHMVRFGTSWVLEREKYVMVLDEGNVALSNPDNRRFTIDVNVKRGADERQREPADALRSLIKVCATANVLKECNRCYQNCHWKSIVRARALDPHQIRIHEHGVKYGQLEWLTLNLLRGFHYFLQSRADTAKKFTSGFYERPDVVQAYYQVDEFYNAIEDRSLQNRFSHLIRERLSPLFVNEVMYSVYRYNAEHT